MGRRGYRFVSNRRRVLGLGLAASRRTASRPEDLLRLVDSAVTAFKGL